MEIVRFPSHGGFSVRSIITFALAVIITALLWATLAHSTPAHAAGEATWNGASLLYEGDQYVTTGRSAGTESHNIAKDATLYTYVEDLQNSTSNVGMQKAHIIYFTPGTDPPTATSANYVVYDYNPTSREYSNPTSRATIAVDPESAATGTTSCAIEGIGWIVCPVMTWLSIGMDFVFNAIVGFMEVQPLQTANTNGSLYSVWNIMRGIANVAFIIVFIIIIYAQLTSFQISNYGLKKLIPRLIIAAVFVNVSYIICAIAIDISNILGYSLQDIFLNIRDQVLGSEADASVASWESVTGFVISGGTAALALGIGTGAALIATGGSVVAAAFLLLPALMGLLLAILVVLLILAARQALITILVVIAPLAIVAYLLPNTEKWFDKWRGLFFTLLVFFPAFSVVFGGSQLAGAIIIYNASSINMLILGMIVMVAPLIITPLLLKFSGGIIGNLARLVNNPNKGILDRTRKWSGAHAERHRMRGISGDRFNGNPGELRKRNFIRQSARRLDQRKRRLEDRTKNSSTNAQSAYENSSLYSNKRYDMSEQTEAAKLTQEGTHARHAAHVEGMKTRPGNVLYQPAMNAQVAKENLETAQQRSGAFYNEQRITGGTPLNVSMSHLEAAKSRFEATDLDKTAYLNTQRTARVTQLGMAAERLEAARLNSEGVQNNYTAHMERLKVSGTSNLGDVSRFAVSSKEHLETAQNNVQVIFDRDRKVEGTMLNISSNALSDSKVSVEGAQAGLAAYVADRKKQTGTPLHENILITEKLKQDQQVAEGSLNRVIEQYRSGNADTSGLTAAERLIVTDMVYNTEQLTAEAQGLNSAKYEQQQHFSQLLAEEDSPRAQELLAIAGSVDDNGSQRALATALAQRSRSRKEVLDNIRSIIGFKNFTNDQIRLLSEGAPVSGIKQSHDVMATALEMTLSGKDNAQIIKALQNIDFSFPGATDDQREELHILAGDALLSNPSKPPFITAGMVGLMKQGLRFDHDPSDPKPFSGTFGVDGLNKLIAFAINREKVDSKKLQSAGKDYADVMFSALLSDGAGITAQAKQRLLSELALTLDPSREASEGLGDSRNVLEQSQDNLAVSSANDGTLTGNLINNSGESYAKAILATIQRRATDIHPAARARLLDEIALINRTGLAKEDVHATLETLENVLRSS